MAEQFGWADAEMRLLNHGYNTTFGLRKGDERAALRINVNSLRSEDQLKGELAWVHALEESEVWVPLPILKRDGSGYLAELSSRRLMPEREESDTMFAVLYGWLPGRTAGHQWTPEVARAVGVATTQLHEHARTWKQPCEAYYSTPHDVMIGCPLNPRAVRPGFETVLERGNTVIDRLHRDQPLIPVHFDIHMWNLKWYRGRLAVFDFDDCRLGWPSWDVAITLFYMRRFANPAECETAYWEGLGKTLDDLGVSHDEMEALIASRGVFLASEMLGEWTAELQQMGTKYVDVTEQRVQHYLETGTFDPNVATLPS